MQSSGLQSYQPVLWLNLRTVWLTHRLMWFDQGPVASTLLHTPVLHLATISVALTYLINAIFYSGFFCPVALTGGEAAPHQQSGALLGCDEQSPAQRPLRPTPPPPPARTQVVYNSSNCRWPPRGACAWSCGPPQHSGKERGMEGPKLGPPHVTVELLNHMYICVKTE